MLEDKTDPDAELLEMLKAASVVHESMLMQKLLRDARNRLIDLLDERDNTERKTGHLMADRAKMKSFLGELKRGEVQDSVGSAAFLLTTLSRMPSDM